MEKTPTTVAKLAKPFIQVGIFGVKSNAIKTGDQMVKLGLPVNTFDFKIKEKTYWRVIAGPAISLENRQNMLTNIKSAGFKDAYFVSN
jgi:cell division protein FtsN